MVLAEPPNAAELAKGPKAYAMDSLLPLERIKHLGQATEEP